MGASLSKKGKYDPSKNNKKKKAQPMVIKNHYERDHFFQNESKFRTNRQFQNSKIYSQTMPDLTRLPDDSDSFTRRRTDPKTRQTLDPSRLHSERSMRSDDYETISVSLHNIADDNIYEDIDEEIAYIDVDEIVQRLKLIKKRIQTFDGSEECGAIVADLDECEAELRGIKMENEQIADLHRKIQQFRQAAEKHGRSKQSKETLVTEAIYVNHAVSEDQNKSHYQAAVQLFADVTKQLDDIKEEMLNYYGASEDPEYAEIMDKLDGINRAVKDVDARSNVNITLTKEQYEDYATRLKKQFEVIVAESEKNFKQQKHTLSTMERNQVRRRRSQILDNNINIKEVHGRLSIDHSAGGIPAGLLASAEDVIQEEIEDPAIYENVAQFTNNSFVFNKDNGRASTVETFKQKFEEVKTAINEHETQEERIEETLANKNYQKRQEEQIVETLANKHIQKTPEFVDETLPKKDVYKTQDANKTVVSKDTNYPEVVAYKHSNKTQENPDETAYKTQTPAEETLVNKHVQKTQEVTTEESIKPHKQANKPPGIEIKQTSSGSSTPNQLSPRRNFRRQLSSTEADDEFFDCEEFLETDEFTVTETFNAFKTDSCSMINDVVQYPQGEELPRDESRIFFMDETPPDDKPTFKSLFGRSISERSNNSQDSEVKMRGNSEGSNYDQMEYKTEDNRTNNSNSLSDKGSVHKRLSYLDDDYIETSEESAAEEMEKVELADPTKVKKPRKVSRITMKYINELKQDYAENLRNLSPSIDTVDNVFSFMDVENNAVKGTSVNNHSPTKPAIKPKPMQLMNQKTKPNISHTDIDGNMPKDIGNKYPPIEETPKEDQETINQKQTLKDSNETLNKTIFLEKVPSFIQFIPDEEITQTDSYTFSDLTAANAILKEAEEDQQQEFVEEEENSPFDQQQEFVEEKGNSPFIKQKVFVEEKGNSPFIKEKVSVEEKGNSPFNKEEGGRYPFNQQQELVEEKGKSPYGQQKKFVEEAGNSLFNQQQEFVENEGNYPFEQQKKVVEEEANSPFDLQKQFVEGDQQQEFVKEEANSPFKEQKEFVEKARNFPFNQQMKFVKEEGNSPFDQQQEFVEEDVMKESSYSEILPKTPRNSVAGQDLSTKSQLKEFTNFSLVSDKLKHLEEEDFNDKTGEKRDVIDKQTFNDDMKNITTTENNKTGLENYARKSINSQKSNDTMLTPDKVAEEKLIEMIDRKEQMFHLNDSSDDDDDVRKHETFYDINLDEAPKTVEDRFFEILPKKDENETPNLTDSLRTENIAMKSSEEFEKGDGKKLNISIAQFSDEESESSPSPGLKLESLIKMRIKKTPSQTSLLEKNALKLDFNEDKPKSLDLTGIEVFFDVDSVDNSTNKQIVNENEGTFEENGSESNKNDVNGLEMNKVKSNKNSDEKSMNKVNENDNINSKAEESLSNENTDHKIATKEIQKDNNVIKEEDRQAKSDVISKLNDHQTESTHSSMEYLDEALDTVPELPSLPVRTFLVDNDLGVVQREMSVVRECLQDIKICVECFEGTKNDEEYHNIYENLFSTMSVLNKIKTADWDAIQEKQNVLQEINVCMSQLEAKVS